MKTKLTNRILSLVIVAIMLISALPITVSGDTSDYDTAALTAINNMIDNNGLSATKDYPDNWGFATWDKTSTPYNLTELYIVGRGLSGSLGKTEYFV